MRTNSATTFRFPTQQAANILLIDDIKCSEVNRYIVVGPPVSLPTWDLLAELRLRVIPSGYDWSFGNWAISMIARIYRYDIGADNTSR